MPFADLDPKSQKFLKNYFKSGFLFFSSGTSKEKKDEMADEFVIWQTKRAEVEQRLRTIPAYVDNGGLAGELAKIITLVEGDKKNFNAAKATQQLGALNLKIDEAGRLYHQRLKAEATAAMTDMRGYHGVARELPKFETRLTGMDTDYNRTPPDFPAIKAAHKFITDGKADLKLISDAFKTDYEETRDIIRDECEARMPTIADPVVAAERARIQTKIDIAWQKLEEHADWLAARIAGATKWEIIETAKIVDQKNDYQPIKQAALDEFQKLETALSPGADAQFPLVKADVEQAAQYETDRDFYNATLIMKPMPDRIAPLLELCTAYDAFDTSLRAANTAVEQLKKHHLAEYVNADTMAVESLIQSCIRLAGNGQYADAKARLDTVPTRCKDLETEAEDAGPFALLLQDAATGDLDALLKQAQDQLAKLKSHDRKDQIAQAITDLETNVKTAEKAITDGKEAEARAALTQAAELASLTYKLTEVIDRIYSRADSLAEGANIITTGHPQAAYLTDKLKEVTDLVDEARAMALSGDDGALAKLTDGEAKLDAAKRLGDAEDAFRTKLGTVRTDANTLATTNYPDKAATGPQIATHLTKAEEHSDAFDHIKANASIAAAEQLIALAKIGRTASTNGDLDADDIKAIMALPGGQKQLDDLVDSMPTPSQKVMIALMDARFNVSAKTFADATDYESDTARSGGDLDVPAPNLKAYYKMLASVPETHSKLNPSLARFDRIEDETGSYYTSLNGAVVMACYNDFDAPGNPLGDASELGNNIDADCVCVPDSVDAPDPTYGTWTTMHEIGHAVDDRKGFMDSNGSKAEFGSWRVHGSNTSEISGEIAAEFDFDPYFIERTMAGGNPDMPDPPAGVDQATWDQRRDDFLDWLAAVREGQNIWDSHAQTNLRKMSSGRMIHEAYANTWVSYDSAARSKGVSGYQFRAPGEWFSELYAAYYTKKLNPSHPAQNWLSTL